MAPSSPPSNSVASTSSICCCSRYFRRAPPSQNGRIPTSRAPIEIKVNGRSHLTIPSVAIIPAKNTETVHNLSRSQGIEENGQMTSIQMGQDDEYETARTSRHTDNAHLVPMKELMRMVRIEEGLEVSPRQIQPQSYPRNDRHNYYQQQAQKKPPPLQLNVANLPSTSSHPSMDSRRIRRAIFNEDGDITTRTMSPSRKSKTDSYRKGASSDRKVSIGSLGVPVLPSLPPSRSNSSTISRRVSAAPQVVAAFVAFTYACVTTILATITNLFMRS